MSVFDSTGWAFEDQIAMEMLIKYTTHFRCGFKVQIESHSADPKNPYDFKNLPSVKSMIDNGDDPLRLLQKNRQQNKRLD